jgi:cytidine deaminase
MVEPSDHELFGKALEARRQSYSPYSNFPVGAALLAKSGKIYIGTNVENASYGLSICAERVALFRAVAEGEREFLKIAVVGSSDEICLPCGACRQVLYELTPDLVVILGTPQGVGESVSLRDLLPRAFTL